MSSALLIIDMQVGLREECGCRAEFDAAVEYINYASAMFRKKGLPVVIVQDMEVAGGPGNAGFDVAPGIIRDASDLVIHKEYCNAFWKTCLEELLRERGVEFVVCSGFAAEHCVLFTWNGARERGFHAALLQRGVAGFDREEIHKAQLLRPVISCQALEYFIG